MNGSEGSSTLSEAQLNFSDKTTMNYETTYTEAPVEPSPSENSNQSGTTLKEHDYIGLSEVSSANSSNDTHPESERREVLDLNESATVLRLGPSALKPEVRDSVRDVREPVAEPEFAKTVQGGIQRKNAILEEFRKAQAMKAVQHAPHAQMMSANPNLPMYHIQKDYEAGQKDKYPTSFRAPYNVFHGVKNNGVKRGFSETVGMSLTGLSGAGGSAREGHCDVNRGEGMGMCMGGTGQPDVKVKLQQGKMWMSLDKPTGSHNPFHVRRTLLQDAGDSSNKVGDEVIKRSLNEAMAPASNDQSSSPVQNQTVGWPPVRSFVRNNNPVKPAPSSPAPTTTCPSVQGKDTSSSTTSKSCLVKIYMDGVPFGRKVDLKANNRYEKLYPALEEMFQQFISGHYSGSQASSSAKSHLISPSRKLNFLDGSEYVLIYEDHEGDFMLVGDVPWELFVNSVKRLRIMKGSEEVNLAPKNADPMKAQPAVG